MRKKFNIKETNGEEQYPVWLSDEHCERFTLDLYYALPKRIHTSLYLDTDDYGESTPLYTLFHQDFYKNCAENGFTMKRRDITKKELYKTLFNTVQWPLPFRVFANEKGDAIRVEGYINNLFFTPLLPHTANDYASYGYWISNNVVYSMTTENTLKVINSMGMAPIPLSAEDCAVTEALNCIIYAAKQNGTLPTVQRIMERAQAELHKATEKKNRIREHKIMDFINDLSNTQRSFYSRIWREAVNCLEYPIGIERIPEDVYTMLHCGENFREITDAVEERFNSRFDEELKEFASKYDISYEKA